MYHNGRFQIWGPCWPDAHQPEWRRGVYECLCCRIRPNSLRYSRRGRTTELWKIFKHLMLEWLWSRCALERNMLTQWEYWIHANRACLPHVSRSLNISFRTQLVRHSSTVTVTVTVTVAVTVTVTVTVTVYLFRRKREKGTTTGSYEAGFAGDAWAAARPHGLDPRLLPAWAWLHVMITVLMTSSTVHPRLRSLTGSLRPCAYMYVCVYVCMYVCMYVCVYVCMYDLSQRYHKDCVYVHDWLR